jgi:3-hydroxyacyl-[acyl-carrier-protein] dehydratase
MTKSLEEYTGMNIQQIMEFLPHRFPMLLVDRVVEFIPGESITALKNVSFNEPYFQGHFPEEPIMPGVLIIEALAQACGIYDYACRAAANESTDFIFLLVSVDKVRFRQQVVPGDQLMLSIKLISKKRNMIKVAAQAIVDGVTVASAELMCAKKEKPVD